MGMLIDVDGLFAQNLSIVNETPKAVDLGSKGIESGNEVKFFIEVSEDFEGCESVDFKLYASNTEHGSEQEYSAVCASKNTIDRLTRGFTYMITLPAIDKRYLILEVEVKGDPTAGRYWAGLTNCDQYGVTNK